ncbi:site-specific integrase [bacterium]|nr:site-specific integrase [bacterium]
MVCVEPIRDKNKIETVKRILKENGSRDYLLFLLGINSGLRISDILKLKVSDVKNKKYIELYEQKTGKYKRFPITNSYKSTLEDFIIGKKSEEWLFASQRGGKPITRIQAYRIICNACSKAGITTRIGTHTLRKTFGYHFYNKTKDIALLQHIFNHSAPSVTLRYIGINQDIIDSNFKAFSL